MESNKKRRGFIAKRGKKGAAVVDLCLDSTQKPAEMVARRPMPYPRDAEMVAPGQPAGRPANYRPSPRPRSTVSQ